MAFADPFWVNSLFLVPLFLFLWFRKSKLSLTKQQLLYIGLFAISLGVIEGSIVVYLRAALGFLPGFKGTFSDIWRFASPLYDQTAVAKQLPQSLLFIETIREISTMVILISISLITVSKLKERVAVFMLAFAVWDITYYIHLWLTVHWPTSLYSPDVLFLIPQLWIAQVWFPLLVSSLTALTVIANSKGK